MTIGTVKKIGEVWQVVPDDGSTPFILPPAKRVELLRVSPNKTMVDVRVQFALRDDGNIAQIGLLVSAEDGSIVAQQQTLPPLRAPGPRPNPSRHVSVNAFANPYNFVATPERAAYEGPFADHEKASRERAGALGHDRLYAERWTGRIGVTMRTKTPLLALDPSRRSGDGQPDRHFVYPIATDAAGNVKISPTSVKGMLRSAYEAVTNSRMSVFKGHDSRLAYRMPPDEGIRLVPVRVFENGKRAQILMGTVPEFENQQPPQVEPLYAAWLPTFTMPGLPIPSRCACGNPFRTGEPVEVSLQMQAHWEADRHGNWGTNFKAWRIIQIAHDRCPYPADWGNLHAPEADPLAGGPHWQWLADDTQEKGWVVCSGNNAHRKHDERVFFTSDPVNPLVVDVTDQSSWYDVIKSYHDAHDERELDAGPTHNAKKWSEHLKSPASRYDIENKDTLFSEEVFCYARVARDASGLPVAVTALFPVPISRALYQLPPLNLLPKSLRPAELLSQMSPADRVFGWTSQEKGGGWRGQLRVGPVRTSVRPTSLIDANGAPSPLRLAILGQPKPQQGRFYVNVPANNQVRQKRNYYESGQTLKGRKVYLHHSGLPDNYWNNDRVVPQAPSAGTGEGQRYVEYKGAAATRQNRSISEWVDAGSEFGFDIEVTNLSLAELGALVWLLDLPEHHCHRLGYGKPLGFGSVRLEINESSTALRNGAEWADLFENFDLSPSTAAATVLARAKELFESWVDGQDFIKDFLSATSGDRQVPVHYPRVRTATDSQFRVPPDAAGESYKWFVANERSQNPQSLPQIGGTLRIP